LLLVRIPKGTIGEETSRLLGAFTVARVWQAVMKRAAVPEAERADTSLYVDEMHNYLALPRSFEDLLAEARGYRLSLVLAHQHMNQLPKTCVRRLRLMPAPSSSSPALPRTLRCSSATSSRT